MKAIIEPGYVSGTVTPPSSKSITQRAYAAALLHKGKTIIHRPGHSEDEQAALLVIQQLGAKILLQTEDRIEIESNGLDPVSDSINCGESGLAARLFTPIAAMRDRAIRIEGNGSLLTRPMEGFKEVLTALGVQLTDFNGHIPFSIQGPARVRSLKIDASGGSQLLSGLLFALSYSATEPITIQVSGLKSKPYIDVTLDVLRKFGKPISHKYYSYFTIDPAQFVHDDTVEITVEADWSSAAYLLVAGAIVGDMTVKNLQQESKQADRAIMDILKSAGADMMVYEDSVTIKRSWLQSFEFDATHCPDLFPALAVLASFCSGESYIKGVHRLFHKESNRVESVTEMLHDFAVPWSVEDDMLFITGGARVQGTIIDSYHDHRIVMAAAIGALRANGPVEITFAESAGKSYPDFFKDIVSCGAKCTFNNDQHEHIW